jgi:hypothetical protein
MENQEARREDTRNIITQSRVNKSRYAWDEENYEDEEKEMVVLCFTRRVRIMWVPKGFKLPHDQQKYDGSQEHKLWLSNYLQEVQILGASRATAMQSLQLHRTSTTRSWLSTLPDDSIGSWGKLENQFTRNFQSMYKRIQRRLDQRVAAKCITLTTAGRREVEHGCIRCVRLGSARWSMVAVGVFGWVGLDSLINTENGEDWR